MSMSHFFSASVVLFVVSAATACDEASVLGSQSDERVTLVVPIDGQQFASGATLTVTVWSSSQLEALDQNARCTTTFNSQTQTQQIVCPDGIRYQEVEPEELSFPVEQAAPRLELKPLSVRVGEKFRVRVAGLYRDNCNTTSAVYDGIAPSAQMVLEDLDWQTTLKGCPVP